MNRLATLILSFCFISSTALAADMVRIRDAANLVVTGTTNTTFNLGVTPPAGASTDENSAAIVYVPITNNSGSFPNHDLYFAESLNGVTTLFDTTDATMTSSTISFPLTLTLSGTRQYLYGAVYNGTNYQIVRSSAPQNATTSTDMNFILNAKSFCTVFASGCNNLAPDSTAMTKGSFKAYFFISTNSNIANGTTFSPSDSGMSGGVYFMVKMSNLIYSSSDLIITIDNPLKKGDLHLVTNYSTSNPITDFDHVVVFDHQTDSLSVPNQPVGAYAVGYLVNASYGSDQTGIITISKIGRGGNTPLINSNTYYLSVGFMDKYKFVTNLSAAGVGTPIKIDELLKKQACYILTAGFGEEHYVTNYFRDFRDKVLVTSRLGRAFIKFYYRSAPHYAVIIYKSNVLRFMVRAFAYILYFLFNFGHLLLIFLAALFFMNLVLKNKILFSKNRL